MALPTDELLGMVKYCGLNRLFQYSTFLSPHIRAARHSAEVKKALQQIKGIIYTGVAIDPEDAEYAHSNDISIFVSMECKFESRQITTLTFAYAYIGELRYLRDRYG